MASFNIPGIPFKLTAEEASGRPDYFQALKNAAQGVGALEDTAVKPMDLATRLLQAQLKNKHDETINKYLDRSEQARIGQQEAAARRSNQLASQSITNPYDKAMLASLAKQNVKDVASGEEELPEAQTLISEIREAIPIIDKHPGWFGAGLGGFDFLGGPGQRERSINDPDYGKIKALFGRLVGPQAQALSGNRILAKALGLAQDIKPGFNENKEIALGKLKQILSESEGRFGESFNRYKKAGGQRNFDVKLQNITEQDIKDTAETTGLTVEKVKELLRKEGHL